MANEFAWRLVLATTALACLAAVAAGGSWGARGSDYDPRGDSNSMHSTTLYTGAQEWWNAGYTGRGIDIAVIDSGVSPVPGLDARRKLVHGPDLSLESQAPNLTRLDTYGHGTFMAGLIAGARRRVPRDGARRAHRQPQGRDRRRRRRRLAGDRRDRLGRPARPRSRAEHPRAQPLVRHELEAELPDRPARPRGRAGVEEGHRRGRSGREHRLPARATASPVSPIPPTTPT